MIIRISIVSEETGEVLAKREAKDSFESAGENLGALERWYDSLHGKVVDDEIKAAKEISDDNGKREADKMMDDEQSVKAFEPEENLGSKHYSLPEDHDCGGFEDGCQTCQDKLER